MVLIDPGYLHRVALAVDDAGIVDEWFGRVLGATPLSGRSKSLAWVTAAVADAEATAAFLADLAGAVPIEGNAQGPTDRELTIDVEVGDMTLRLVTPRSSESPYASVLERGPRLCSIAMRVVDLDRALKTLDAFGVPTSRRDGDLAATDPAATFGVPIEWTS